MPLITAADLDFALTDIGDPVAYGEQSCFGDLKRMPIHEPTDNGMTRIGTDITLLIRDGALTGLAIDEPITVASTAFVIRDCGVRLPDGSRILTITEV